MTSVLPLEPLAVSYTSTQAALVNTVSEIVQGIHLESWALSPLPLLPVPAASPGNLELSALAKS